MAAIRYFFSYARADTEFVLKLATELRTVGADVWVDQLDIMAGQRWDHAVEEALETCQGMIIVLSPHSVASINVMDEVSYALGKTKPIIPILLRPCNIPFRLQRLQQVDFTGDYDAGFTRLLRDLKIERPAPAEVPQPRQTRQAAQVFTKPVIARDNARRVSPASQEFLATETIPEGFMALRQRLRSTLIGAAIGAIWGAIAVASNHGSDGTTTIESGAFFVGIAGAITGAITGTNWKVVAVTVVGIIIVVALWAMSGDGITHMLYVALFYAPSVAIVGALIGVGLKKLLGWK